MVYVVVRKVTSFVGNRRNSHSFINNQHTSMSKTSKKTVTKKVASKKVAKKSTKKVAKKAK